MCTTESVVLGVTPKGREDTNRRTFSFSDERDRKEEEPFITPRNRGYSVDSESMVLLNLERSSPGISPRRRKSYSSDEESVTIRPSKYSSSRRDRRVPRTRSESPSRTPSIIPQTYERDRSVSSVSASPVKAHRKRSSTPKENRSPGHYSSHSTQEYKTESPRSPWHERNTSYTSRRKRILDSKKRPSRPASPAYGQSSEDELNEKQTKGRYNTPISTGSFNYEKSGIPDCKLEKVNVDRKLQDMVESFGLQTCFIAIRQFSDMMFLSFMKKYLQLCPEKGQSGSIWKSDIEDLAILATLNSPALSRKKKNELRKAWKILLANTIINNAVETYHYSKCSGNVNKRQKEEPCNCLGKSFLFGMTPHAYFSVDMIDNILNKTLEELIEEAFPNVYNIDTVTYSELAGELKASVVRSSSSKKNAQASQWLEINFRVSESIAASQKKDSSFGQFLLNYLYDPERKIFRSIAQSLSNAKEMDRHLMSRMNRNTYARQSARDTRTRRRMNQHTREMAEASKKEKELAALYQTPAFQAELVAKTLSKLKYSEDMKSKLTVKSLKLRAEKIAEIAEIAEIARREKVWQELYDECEKENHRKNREKRTKKKRRKKSKIRHDKRKKSQNRRTITETDEESLSSSEPSYEQKYPPSYERPEESILHALKNKPYKRGWRVHQRVKKWNGSNPTYDRGDRAHNPENEPTPKAIADHNLSDLIYLLSSDIKNDYTVPYNFYDRKSKSIYGPDKEGRALIAEMRYNGTTYYGTIFLGIGYDEEEGGNVLYHAQFVDYGRREISLHDISENFSTQLQALSRASDRVEKPAEDTGWKRKGKFTVEDGNVIVMDTKRAGSREIEATFYIYPR